MVDGQLSAESPVAQALLGALTDVEYRDAATPSAWTSSDDGVGRVVCRWGYMLMADPAAALKETSACCATASRSAFARLERTSIATPGRRVPGMTLRPARVTCLPPEPGCRADLRASETRPDRASSSPAAGLRRPRAGGARVRVPLRGLRRRRGTRSSASRARSPGRSTRLPDDERQATPRWRSGRTSSGLIATTTVPTRAPAVSWGALARCRIGPRRRAQPCARGRCTDSMPRHPRPSRHGVEERSRRASAISATALAANGGGHAEARRGVVTRSTVARRSAATAMRLLS